MKGIYNTVTDNATQSMPRVTYAKIAQEVRQTTALYRDTNPEPAEAVLRRIATIFEAADPSFDRARFLRDAGVR